MFTRIRRCSVLHCNRYITQFGKQMIKSFATASSSVMTSHFIENRIRDICREFEILASSLILMPEKPQQQRKCCITLVLWEILEMLMMEIQLFFCFILMCRLQTSYKKKEIEELQFRVQQFHFHGKTVLSILSIHLDMWTSQLKWNDVYVF